MHIDGLIQAGWRVVATDFDNSAFLNWKQRSQECLAQVLDEDHPQFEVFRRLTAGSLQDPQSNTLPLIGILEAVKHGSLNEGAYRASSLH
jgi:hypothetical protein